MRRLFGNLLLSLVFVVGGCGGEKDSGENEQTKTKTKIKSGSDRPYPDLKRDKITQIVVSWGKYTIAIERAAPFWRVTTPFVDNADPRMVRAVLRELDQVELGHEPVTTNPKGWKHYDLAPDQVVSLYVTYDGVKLPPLHIGAKKYARIGDKPGVYTRLHMNRYTFSQPPAVWRDRQLLRFTAAKATALEAVDQKGRRIVASRVAAPAPKEKRRARAPDTWTLTRGKKLVGKLNQTIPNVIFRRLQILQAVDVATVDAAAAGVDKPRVTLIVHAGSKQYALLLGKTEGTQVYAQVRGNDRIWKLRASDVHPALRPLAAWSKPL